MTVALKDANYVKPISFELQEWRPLENGGHCGSVIYLFNAVTSAELSFRYDCRNFM